jgi:hypothetical protein
MALQNIGGQEPKKKKQTTKSYKRPVPKHQQNSFFVVML